MSGILFLLASFGFGASVLSYFGLARGDSLVRFSHSFLVGILTSTWLAYAVVGVFGISGPALWLVILLLSAGTAMLKAKPFKMLVAEGLDRRSFLPRAVLALGILPFFVFGFNESGSGELFFRGYYVDLSYHMAIARTFLEHPGLPPINIQCGGIPLYYHFLIDFHSALLIAGGMGLLAAFNVPQVLLAVCLVVAVVDIFTLLLRGTSAVLFASMLFIFGHDGFFALVFSILGFRAYIPYDRELTWSNLYTIVFSPFLHFLSPVFSFFQPQRPMLFAFPFALFCFGHFVEMYRRNSRFAGDDRRKLLILSIFTALLPMFHGHAFLMLVSIFAIVWLRAGMGRELVLTLVVCGLIAFPQLNYLRIGAQAPMFSGFDVGHLFQKADSFQFSSFLPLSHLLVWVRACGFAFLIGNIAVLLLLLPRFRRQIESRLAMPPVIVTYLVFGAYFILINFYRFTPWWGDGNKFFLFWNLALCSLSAAACAAIPGTFLRRITCTFVLLAGGVIPWSIQSAELLLRTQTFFTPCERVAVQWISENVGKDAIFGSADDVIHPLTALAGRIVADGSYTTTSFAVPQEVKDEIWSIFRSGDPRLIRKYRLTHLILTPREKGRLNPNLSALSKVTDKIFEMQCAGETYSVLKIRPGPLPESHSREVYLSTIKPLYRQQRWGELQYDRNVLSLPIKLNGIVYEHGLGAHAWGRIEYQLNGAYTRFRATVGIDDSQSGGSAIFRVMGDSRELYRSPLMQRGDTPANFDIDISGVQKLILFMDDGGDGWPDDNTVWADPVLTLKERDR